ncbi:GNAT family N-acetyltransferase [Oxalicibacterium flavum]
MSNEPCSSRSDVTITDVTTEDLDELVAIRIEAMRESLERIKRFDPVRARERFTSNFDPQRTKFILLGHQRTGFFVTRILPHTLLLDHLYIIPAYQNQGIGRHVLSHIFKEADGVGLPVTVGALRESASNRFYLRHGFKLVKSDEYDNYYQR